MVDIVITSLLKFSFRDVIVVSECCRSNSKRSKGLLKVFGKDDTVNCFYVTKCVTVNRSVGGFC